MSFSTQTLDFVIIDRQNRLELPELSDGLLVDSRQATPWVPQTSKTIRMRHQWIRTYLIRALVQGTTQISYHRSKFQGRKSKVVRAV